MTSTEIINSLTQKIADNEAISPFEYIASAAKLNLSIAEDQKLLYELQQKVSQKKADLIIGGNAISLAKILVEATDEYREYLMQKAKVEQIIEMIRIAKIQSRLTNEGEYKGF